MSVTSVAFCGAEACLAVIDFAPDCVHLMIPVTVGLNDLEIKVGKVKRETCSSFNDDIAGAIVGDLEAPGNGIVLWKDGVGEHSSNVRDVVVELDLQSCYVRIIAVSCWESGDRRLARDDLVGLVEERRHCVSVRVLNMDCWQTNVTSTNIWKFPSVVGFVVMPTPW